MLFMHWLLESSQQCHEVGVVTFIFIVEETSMDKSLDQSHIANKRLS